VTREDVADAMTQRLKLQTALVMLSGAFEGEGYTLHIEELTVHELPRSLYVQMIRTDDPLDTLWRQVWGLHLIDGELVVRVSEFAPDTDYGAVFTGAWAAPQKFPAVVRARLHAVGDLHARMGRRSMSLTARAPFPTMRKDAHHLDMEVSVEGDRLEWRIAGLDERGQAVWGSEPVALERIAYEPPVVEHENGLVAIELREGEGRAARKGDRIQIAYTGYIMTGHSFYSTDWQGQQAVSATLPADYIEGWNQGVLGMKPGGVRRIVVPPWLGYGVQPRGMIPPNSWLIFDLSMKDVRPAGPGADAEETP